MATACSAPTSTPTTQDSDRYLFHIAQGGLGLPDESYYREDKFAEIREKYVDYLDRLLELADSRRRTRRGRDRVLEIETRLAAGHWERAETRDVQKTYNLTTARRAARAGARLRLGRLRPQPRRLRGDASRRPASVSRRTSRTSRRCSLRSPIEDWKAWLLTRVLRVRGAVPHRRLRRDQLRLLRPHPQRHPRAAGPLEARGRPGRGRRSARPSASIYVARHFPPESKAQMDDLVANLLAAYRESITKLDWMTEETKQRAFEQAGRRSGPRSATPTSSATTRRCRSGPTT